MSFRAFSLHDRGVSNLRTLAGIAALMLANVPFLLQPVTAAEPVTFDDGNGKGRVFTDYFDGRNRPAGILTYYSGSEDWVLRSYDGTRMAPVTVGNTSGFGNLDDGRPMWSGDFDGDGRSDVLFYFPGDGNWWLGSYNSGRLTWRLASNTSGATSGDNNFGNLTRSGVRIWTGDFSRTGQSDVLFYNAGDSNWWLGTWNGGRIVWSLAGNTVGFGNLGKGQPCLY